MKTDGFLFRCVCLCLGLLILTAGLSVVAAAEDTRYVTTTLRGRLTDPDGGKPLVGAVVRFVSTEEGGTRSEAVTDSTGAFAVEGLTYSLYAVEIETAEGETIRGINALPVGEDESVEVVLKISDRVQSTTSLDNRPERFAALVKREPVRWKRFWREFGVFWGIAIVVAIAVL